MVTEEPRATGSPPLWTQKCRKPWTVVVLSALCSAVSVAAVGSVAAFLYPILRDLRAERVTRQDGTEVRMLGFWSIMVVSLSAGCVCSIFSWIIIYLDSYQPGMVITKPRFLSYFRIRVKEALPLLALEQSLLDKPLPSATDNDNVIKVAERSMWIHAIHCKKVLKELAPTHDSSTTEETSDQLHSIHHGS
ncbi:ADP-ribosylation factor-like protein 6-interacting protein 6 isoform X1 [Thalassophryne amazonica]|uniref:ADP-ribosylation factor-like protein 6-interacting protein 6 isoform X1 n=1 Tax=Thalassophryne amazonica TaxID=390379 RepID=UPI0014711BB5|nr:ADP-ribosylation factor-like protein 6-interacting protein 6 isoform X1 [Thalassophryne amazonica]